MAAAGTGAPPSGSTPTGAFPTDPPQMSGTQRVAVLRLSLSDFRNYASLNCRFGPRSVVLFGANGAGKTNLLEAISLFGPGRGLRRAAFAEIARAGGPGGWAVAAEAEGPAGAVRLGTGQIGAEAGTDLGAGGDAGPRQCRIDGASVRSAGAFADHLRITWLTPAQDRLFTGPAGDRRRFLDRLVATMDPAHGRQVQGFEQAMKERNRLLDTGGEAAWLTAIEAQMAAAGIAVAAGRAAAAGRLGDLLANRAGASAFPPALVALEGDLEARLSEAPAVDVEDGYRATLRDARPRDRAAGRALNGPHRSDLEVSHGGTGHPAAHCSTGEQKALLISIILAEARLIAADFSGFAPILLLDEVAAHLDPTRREALFDELEALGAQAWMTGTERSLFAACEGRATFAEVSTGRISL